MSLTVAAPSPMLHALDVARALVAQAQDNGIEVGSVMVSGDVCIYAKGDGLAPALAVALGLTTRIEHHLDRGHFEFFHGEVDGVPVQTHGRIPDGEVTP